MRKLIIPPALKTELEAVEAIWETSAQTRRVDALVLSWVKYEKQLRRLFSFFVFQHPRITAKQLDPVVAAFAASRNLYPETFIKGIAKLGAKPIPTLLGNTYHSLWPEIVRIKRYRNKIMHGQMTGKKIKSPQLEKDVLYLVKWMGALANAAQIEYGYDGLRRNTYISAKSAAAVAVQRYPFSNAKELKAWLATL